MPVTGRDGDGEGREDIMPYDENSFLQGVAVGRALKGVSVIQKDGGGGTVVVDSVSVTLPIGFNVSATVPVSDGVSALTASGELTIETS